MRYFYSFLALSFNSIFFLTEAAQYESSYRRTAHHATSSQPANYRPISKVSVSKVTERFVLARLRPHLLGSANFSQFQSAYRKGITRRLQY